MSNVIDFVAYREQRLAEQEVQKWITDTVIPTRQKWDSGEYSTTLSTEDVFGIIFSAEVRDEGQPFGYVERFRPDTEE